MDKHIKKIKIFSNGRLFWHPTISSMLPMSSPSTVQMFNPAPAMTPIPVNLKGSSKHSRSYCLACIYVCRICVQLCGVPNTLFNPP